MRSISKLSIIAVILGNFLLGIGTQFLSLPGTARELGMGVNPVLGTSPTANPALLSPTGSGPELTLSHGAWFSGVKNTTVGIDRATNGLDRGIRIRYAGLNDLDLRTERPTDEPLSQYGAFGLSFNALMAKTIGSTRYGVAVKFLTLQIYHESSTGYALDAGFVQSVGKRFKWGASLLNAGTMSELYMESPALPLRVIGGAAYRFEGQHVVNWASASAEWSSAVSGGIFRVGNEMRWNKLAVCLGSQVADNVFQISGGIGITLGRYGFYYSVQVGTQDLGVPQMMDITVRLP